MGLLRAVASAAETVAAHGALSAPCLGGVQLSGLVTFSTYVISYTSLQQTATSSVGRQLNKAPHGAELLFNDDVVIVDGVFSGELCDPKTSVPNQRGSRSCR